MGEDEKILREIIEMNKLLIKDDPEEKNQNIVKRQKEKTEQ